jgi:CoA:oxalate CoA-transferase
MPKGSLEGIRVLLIGHVWAGPMCAALFSDMGAEVIRLESHTRIDGYRILFAKDEGNIEQGPFYQVINRNALSVTLNMRQPKANRYRYRTLRR